MLHQVTETRTHCFACWEVQPGTLRHPDLRINILGRWRQVGEWMLLRCLSSGCPCAQQLDRVTTAFLLLDCCLRHGLKLYCVVTAESLLCSAAA